MATAFATKENMVQTVTRNVLEETLNGFWMFLQDTNLKNAILRLVERGAIEVDMSNLNKEDWDAFFRFKVVNMSTLELMQFTSWFVNSCHPDQMGMGADNVVWFWWH